MDDLLLAMARTMIPPPLMASEEARTSRIKDLPLTELRRFRILFVTSAGILHSKSINVYRDEIGVEFEATVKARQTLKWFGFILVNNASCSVFFKSIDPVDVVHGDSIVANYPLKFDVPF